MTRGLRAGGRRELGDSILPAFFIISWYKFVRASILAKDSGEMRRVDVRQGLWHTHPCPTPDPLRQDPDADRSSADTSRLQGQSKRQARLGAEVGGSRRAWWGTCCEHLNLPEDWSFLSTPQPLLLLSRVLAPASPSFTTRELSSWNFTSSQELFAKTIASSPFPAQVSHSHPSPQHFSSSRNSLLHFLPSASFLTVPAPQVSSACRLPVCLPAGTLISQVPPAPSRTF